MLALLVAVSMAPWAHPLSFRPIPGWRFGSSGSTSSVYVGHKKWIAEPLESTAWIAHGVRYRDPPTADPPNQTLATLPRGAVIVWAVIYSPVEQSEKPINLDLRAARRYACCEEAGIPAEYDLAGAGPQRAYSVIVRVYFGSPPNPRLRAQAQLALRHLRLPPHA